MTSQKTTDQDRLLALRLQQSAKELRVLHGELLDKMNNSYRLAIHLEREAEELVSRLKERSINNTDE